MILGKQPVLCEVQAKKIVGFYGCYHLLVNNNNNKTAYNLQNKAREQIGLTFNIIFFSYCLMPYRDIVL